MLIKLIYSTIFGIIQGLTEFLPVSSSGHLIIFHQILNLQVDSLIFDVALHLGTLLALLLFFREKFFRLFRGWKQGLPPTQTKQEFKLLSYIVIATIPAVIAGLFLENIIELYLRNIIAVSWALIIGGILLILFDTYSDKQRNFSSLSLGETFLIGVAQSLALIPGVSRSAITIIAGLGLKLQRRAAAEFSFLLAIPIIFGAGVKKMLDLNILKLSFEDSLIFGVGVFVSFIVGYLVIKYFIKFLERHSLVWFGWYRILLGVGMLLWIYFQ